MLFVSACIHIYTYIPGNSSTTALKSQPNICFTHSPENDCLYFSWFEWPTISLQTP